MPDPNRTEMPVHDAFVRFEDARIDLHTEHWLGFWGRPKTFQFLLSAQHLLLQLRPLQPKLPNCRSRKQAPLYPRAPWPLQHRRHGRPLPTLI